MKIRIIKESKTKKLDENGGPIMTYGEPGSAAHDRWKKDYEETTAKNQQALRDIYTWAKKNPVHAAQIIFEVVGLFPVVGAPGDIIAAGIAFYRYSKGEEDALIDGVLNLSAAIPAFGLVGASTLKAAYRGGGAPAAKETLRAAARRVGWTPATVKGLVNKPMEETWDALKLVLEKHGVTERWIQYVQWHFAKFDAFFQFIATSIMLGPMVYDYMTSKEEAEQYYTPQDFDWSGGKAAAPATERPPPRQQYTKVMP